MKKLFTLFLLTLFILNGCVNTTYTARSNGIGKTSENYGGTAGLATGVYYSRSYGVSKNSDVGVDLELFAYADPMEEFASGVASNIAHSNHSVTPIKPAVGISSWYKFAFINSPDKFSSSVRFTTGAMTSPPFGRLNVSSINSYKFENFEPYFIVKVGIPDMVSASAGTSYWFTKREAINVGINTLGYIPSGISLGYQKALD